MLRLVALTRAKVVGSGSAGAHGRHYDNSVVGENATLFYN